jgi:hypothetical protein
MDRLFDLPRHRMPGIRSVVRDPSRCRLDQVAFGIRRFGFFGNNLVQLIFCLINAHQGGVHQLIIPNGFLLITDSFSTTDGFHIFLNGTCTPAKVYWKFWWNRPRSLRPSPKAICDTLRVPMSRFYPKVATPNDTLVMHLRAFDFFGTDKWQPPCAFYLGAMARFQRSIAIAADYENPCLRVVLSHGAVWANQSLLYDFATLLWAQNFALSVSTFSNAAVLLSPIPKNLFFFREQPPIGKEDGYIRDFHFCRPSVTYQRMAVNNIERTPENIRLLLEDNCTWMS